MGEATVRCPMHPQREFPAHYRFCDVCGQPLMAQAAVSEAGPPSVAEESFSGSCPQCDTPSRPGWRFCQKCGAALPTEPLKEIKREIDKTITPTVEEGVAPAPPVTHCPRCRAATKEDMRFCQVCGFRLIEELKVEGPLCRHCGARLQVGFKFCQTCGAPVKAPPQQWFTLVLSQFRQLGQHTLEAAQDKRLLLAAGSLILLVGLGIGGWYVYEQYFQREPEGTGKATSGGKPGDAPSLFVLTVISTPPHCEVFLDGHRRGQTDALGRLALRNLPEGQHTIRVRREGYYEWSQNVDIRFSMDLPAQLTPLPPVTLTLMTTLPGCTVYLDNQAVATTDATGQAVIPNVKQGQHSVRVSREGYEDWSQSITLQADWTLNATLRRLPYERRLQIARNHINAGRRDRALNLLDELAAEEPNRPEAYELMGKIHYNQNDFSQAHQILGQAIERGGQAQLPVTHDHLGGLDPVDRANREWKNYCNGTLIITNGTLQFRGGQPGDEFRVGRTEIREANMNQWVGLEIAAFNIKIRTGGSERNFNFAPRTKQPAESRMILALISAYVR